MYFTAKNTVCYILFHIVQIQYYQIVCHVSRNNESENATAMDVDEESYGDLCNLDDMSPRCLDMSLAQEAVMESSIGDDALRMTNTNHSYLSPTTKRLHQDIFEVTCETMNNDESIAASKKNMYSCLNWMYTHGDLLNNQKCAEIMRELEQTIVGAKVAIQREILVTPTKKGLSFPELDTKKPRKQPTRAKGVCG